MHIRLVIPSVFVALVLGACTGSTLPVDATATTPTISTSSVAQPIPVQLLDVSLALRTFDRIRSAGIRIVDGAAHVMTASDEFPEIARGVTLGSP